MQSSTGRWADLFLIVALVFGAIVRFAPTLLAGSTINDGGLFSVMIEDIRANGFRLPATTSYNGLGIPFAYPPLSLYVGALLSLTGLAADQIIRWLPPAVSTLSLLAFFWTSGHILSSRSKAALATVAYALMPRSFSWYVMGGGLSRSFGILFLLLTCGSVWVMFQRSRGRSVFLTALFGSGAVLSHPETGLHTLAACLLIWLFRGRSRHGLRDAALVAGSVLILTSPWWGAVVAQNGLAPFQSAVNTGAHNGAFWTPWITMDFAEERFTTMLTVLGLAGLAVQWIRQHWFLPVWLLLPFVIEPRSATAIAALPLAMLAGVGLADLVIPNIASLASRSAAPDGADWTVAIAGSRAARIVLAYVLFSAFVGAFTYDLGLSTYTVPPTSRQAMEWARTNTSPERHFLVLTGRADPFSDPTAEWFPVLSQRRSENTIQGREWTLRTGFMPFLRDLGALRACLNAQPACLDRWAAANGASFSYVFIEKPADPKAAEPSGLLLYQLRQDAQYALVFENSGAAIFEKK